MKWPVRKFSKLVIQIIIGLFVISYIVRPLPISKSYIVKPGIKYERIVRYIYPFRIIHIVRIDLSNPFIHFLVTPPNLYPGENVSIGEEMFAELRAQSTSAFATKNKTTVAINGGLFFPFFDSNPFSYEPDEGDFVDIHGETISNGRIISPSKYGWPVLCIGEKNEITIPPDFKCPSTTWNAISGKYPLIQNGITLSSGKGEPESAPRTGIGITGGDSPELLFVVIDGRQPLYSGGVTSEEFASELISFGIIDALELDGGGSSTLVIDRGDGEKVVNSPIHTRIPLRERPVGSHLGVVWRSDNE